jgi:branched-chain amino acid transport system substrate-binding protein
MKSNRIIAGVSFLLLLALFVGCARLTTVTEKPAPPPPAPQLTPQEEIVPQVIKPPEEKLPSFQFPALESTDRNAIGCLLPLSGKYGESGNKALDAILLAGRMFDEKEQSPWKIIAEDSQGTPEGAKNAVAKLVKIKNVIAIIAIAGTLEAIDAAREADNQKVPIIMITPKEGITGGSEYVFQHFLTPSQQIKALTKYTLNSLNCAIFSILYPKDDYGMEMVKIFREEAVQIGGKVERAIPYGKTQTDFTEEINKLTKYAVSSAKKANANNPEKKVQVRIDFEALFIPDSYQRVKMIASQLAFYDVKGMYLLGTSLWNSPELLKKGPEYLEGAVFADSFFVNSFYPEANDFVDIYYSAYSREPENIEALAYDTASIIISVLDDKQIKTRRQFAGALKKVENYKGATGTISFDADRVAQKTAFILRVKDGKLEQVK